MPGMIYDNNSGRAAFTPRLDNTLAQCRTDNVYDRSQHEYILNKAKRKDNSFKYNNGSDSGYSAKIYPGYNVHNLCKGNIDKHVINNRHEETTKHGFDSHNHGGSEPIRNSNFIYDKNSVNIKDKEFEKGVYNGTHPYSSNSVGDYRKAKIAENKEYLRKKQFENGSYSLHYDIYKYSEPRKAKVCATSIQDLDSNIQVLPYSTPTMDSTYDIMEKYRSPQGSSNHVPSNGYLQYDYDTSLRDTSVVRTSSAADRVQDGERKAFLKGMIDFKCHGIVGTLAKMAVIKGDLIDLLAVKMNANTMLNDTYHSIANQGAKPIGSKTVYFTDMFQPWLQGPQSHQSWLPEQHQRYHTNGGADEVDGRWAQPRESVKIERNVSIEEYHRGMLHGDDTVDDISGDNSSYHRYTLHEDTKYQRQSSPDEGSSSHRIRHNRNSNSSVDTARNSAMSSKRGNRSTHDRKSSGRAKNKSYTASTCDSTGKQYHKIRDMHMDPTCRSQPINDPIYATIDTDRMDPDILSTAGTRTLYDEYYESIPSYERQQDSNGINKSKHSSTSSMDGSYDRRGNRSKHERKSSGQPGSKSYSRSTSNTYDSIDNLSINPDYGTAKYHEIRDTDIEPTNKLKQNSKYNLDGLYDSITSTNLHSDSLLSFSPTRKARGDSYNVLDDSVCGQNTSVYDSYDGGARTPSYGLLCKKYGLDSSSLTSLSSLSSFSKEDEGYENTRNIHGSSSNTHSLYKPYTTEPVQLNQGPSPSHVQRSISVTSSEDMSHLPGKSSGRKREVKPNFIIKPRRCFADEGGMGKFKASFEGEPMPSVEWQMKGDEITASGKYKIYSQGGFHFLEINNIERSDKGQYTCVLTNPLGHAKAMAELEVYAARKKMDSESRTPTSKLGGDSQTKSSTSVLGTKTTATNGTESAKSSLRSNVATKIFQDSAKRNVTKKESTGLRSVSRKSDEDILNKKASDGTTERVSSVKSSYTARLSSATTKPVESTYESKVKQFSNTPVRLNEREKTPPSTKYGQVKSKIGSRRDNESKSTLQTTVRDEPSKKSTEIKINKFESKDSILDDKLPGKATSSVGSDSTKTVDTVIYKKDFSTTDETPDKTRSGVSTLSSLRNTDVPGKTDKFGVSTVGIKSRSSKLEETASKFEKGEVSGGNKSQSKYQSPLSNRGITGTLPGDSKFSSVKSRFEDKSTKDDSKFGASGTKSSSLRENKFSSSIETKTVEDKPRKSNDIEGKAFTTGVFSEQKHKFEDKSKETSSDTGGLGEVGTVFEPRKQKQSKLRSLSQKFAEFEENDNDEFNPVKLQAKKQEQLSKQIEDIEVSESVQQEDVFLETTLQTKHIDNEPSESSRNQEFKSSLQSTKPSAEPVSDKSSVRSRYQPKSAEPVSKRTPQSDKKANTTPSPASKRGTGLSSTVSTALSKTENLTGRRGARNPPEVAVPLTDMEATDGQYVKLKCSFTGSPSPTISWYFNGAIQKDSTEIKQNFDGQWATLKFKDVFPDDTGRYEAVATNRFGEAKTACILTVKEAKPPKLAPAFTRPLQDKTISDGDSLEFKCEYTGNPEPELTWYHEDKVLEACKDFTMTFENGVAILKITEVFPEDAGLYELHAKNEKGETKTVANLTVQDPPGDQHISQNSEEQNEKPAFLRGLNDATVYDGQKVTLQVEVSGSLPIEVCWVHGQEEIGQQHGIYQVISDGYIHKLIIPDVIPEDQGTWVCEAYNNYGDVDTSCVITVRGLSDKSSDLSSTEMHARDEMDDKAISRDKGILAERKGQIRNENLYQAPKFIMKPKSVNTDEGNGAKFACEVVGNPAPTVTWAKDGKELQGTGRFKSWHDGWKHFFEISHALVTDAGKYDCIVSNNQGEVNCTITLIVKKIDSPSGISDFRSLLKARPQLGSKINKSSASSSESEAEQLDFRGVLTRHVKTKSRPQILEELRDIQVNEGQSVTLQCKVKGIPTPDISWLMGQKEIVESRYFKMSYDNNIAELCLAGVYPEDQGEYTCMAKNEAGAVESSCDILVIEAQSPSDSTLELTSQPGGKTAYDDGEFSESQESGYTDDVSQPESSSGSKYIQDIHDNEPPFIEDLQPENLAVLNGESFQIKAKFVGSEPLDVKWSHGKVMLKSDKHHKIQTDAVTSTLTVSSCTEGDTGIYTFSLNNPFGSDSINASVTVEDNTEQLSDIPDAPVGKPAISDITSSSMTLAWSGPSYDGGSQVTCYKVEIKQDGSPKWETLTTKCKDTTYHITDLESNCDYICRVSAGNKHGFSEPSKSSDKVLTIDKRCSPPVNGFVVYQSGEFYDDDEFALTSPLSPMAMISARYQLPFEPKHVEIVPNRNFKDFYEVGEEIGRGRFGNVYKCEELSTSFRLAAKMIRVKASQREDVVREVEIMNSLHHPKLLLLWDAFQAPREMILVMEHIAGGELFERIIDDDYILTERECVHFMRQICEGVRFMHEKKILHLDLKPENILCITPNSNEIKIIDFGLARRFNPDVPSKVMFGTPEFVAPEVINYDSIGFETDMWSVGVICYILMSGLSPFLGDNDAETLANVTMATWDFEDEVFDEISDDAKNFIQLLLSKNMSKRIQVNRALRHRWLSQDVKYMKAKRLSTDKHKSFLARRKWQKTGHAIRALGRMATLQKAISTPRQNSNGSISPYSSSSHSRTGSQASDVSLLSGPDNSTNQERFNTRGSPLHEESYEPYQNGNSAGSSDLDSSIADTVKSQDINSNELSKNTTIPKSTTSVNSSTVTKETMSHDECDDDEDTAGKPCFKQEMMDFEVYEGDSARFDVIIDTPVDGGNFNVKWFKDGEEIAQNRRKYLIEQNKGGKCSLIVKTCDLKDDAQYSCEISNEHGKTTSSAELFVESVFGTTSESTTC